MDLDEIQQIFFQECEEGLAAMESNFGLCTDNSHDAETINTIFRAIHSIKGGAGAFGHERLQGFAHHYETVLDKLRTNEIVLDAPLLTVLLSAFDMLADHVAAARGQIPTPDDTAVLAKLLEVQEGGGAASAAPAPAPEPAAPAAITVAQTEVAQAEAPAAGADFDFDFDDIMGMLDAAGPPPSAPAPWIVTFKPDRHAFDNGGEPSLLLRELVRLGGETVEADLSDLPPIETLDPTKSCLAWTISVPGDVEEVDIHAVFDFVSGLCELTVAREDDEEAEDEDDFGTVAEIPVEEISIEEVAPSAPEDRKAIVEAILPDVAIAQVAAPPVPAPAVAAAVAEASAIKDNAPPVMAAGSRDASAERAATAQASQTIRVDLDKLDRLVNLVGELVITQAMLAQRLSEDGLSGIAEVTDLDHLTRELQDSAMSIRAQPMKSVFSRVPRIIRELEGDTGKKVRLEIEGEMTEVDKTVVERIGEPLTHMIRNAVDHGLEMPDERVAAGKSAEGLVRLRAEHRSGRIIISVSDDGRGIDRVRVRQKAVEKGIIAADAQLSDEEVDNLIFAPGFSTAATVSNISGRGVGMDVVRKNVQALGGRIGIQSRFGHGSTFSLSLPLTLAVVDGMIVSVGDQTYVVPLSHIVESLRPANGDVKHVGPGSSLLDVRGSYVPIHRVGQSLGIGDAVMEPENAVLIVVETDGGKAVLMVDAIQDQRQVVVKSLEANYCAVHGLAGATILGDGRVALIIDVDSLTSKWRHDVESIAA